MSTLIACDYEGCEATLAVAIPDSAWPLTATVKTEWVAVFEQSSARENGPRIDLCPEHAKRISRKQWDTRTRAASVQP